MTVAPCVHGGQREDAAGSCTDDLLKHTAAPASLPDRVRVVRGTSGLRPGDVLARDARHDGFLIGPAWVCVRVVDVVRGWGVFFAEARG